MVPLGLFLCLCQEARMAELMSKESYLNRLLALSDAMISALEKGDVDIAGELFDERDRLIASAQFDEKPAPEGLVDRVLERDQQVIIAAQSHRQQMVGLAGRLNTVRGYSSRLPTEPDRGNWGSG